MTKLCSQCSVAFLVLMVIVSGVGSTESSAQTMRGSDVLSAGATNGTSSTYSLRGTVGQLGFGSRVGAGDKAINAGFWYTYSGIVPAILMADLKLFLEGPYSGSGSMQTDANSVTPISQPYGDPHYDGTAIAYAGSESVDSLEANVVDWVVVELRSDTTDGSNVVTRAALLMSDGFVRDLDMISPIQFDGVDAGDYYVIVRHGNHLPVMSATKIALGSSSSPGIYDFSSSAAAAFGVGATKEVESGVFALYGGDENQDGQVTAPDFNEYLVSTTGGVTGYVSADFNRDGQVTAPDFNIYLANTASGATSRVPDGASAADSVSADVNTDLSDIATTKQKKFPWEKGSK